MENKSKDNLSLYAAYEELRAYALSPVKTPSRPLGLDLWLKKGFLFWSIVRLEKDSQISSYTPIKQQSSDISAELIISLSNILREWSDKNDR